MGVEVCEKGKLLRIRTKLFLFAVLCSVLPLIAAFKLSFDAANKSFSNTVEQNLLAHATEELSMLQNRLANAKHQLVTLGMLGNVQAVQADYSNSLQADIERYAGRSPLFAEIIATNERGDVVAASLIQYLTINMAGTWEFEAPKLGIQFDGRVVRSHRLKKHIAAQSVPIYKDDDNKTLIGTLIGSIDWDFLRQDLSTRSLFGGQQNQQRQVFLEAVADKAILYGTENVEVPEDLFSNIEESGKVRVVNRDGHEYMMVSVDSEAIFGFRNPQWRLHVLLDTEIAYASAESLKNYYLIVGGIVLLLALLMSYLLSGTIVNPVNSLLTGAQQLARGEYDKPLPERGKTDEIGQLTSTFNLMRVAIQNNQSELVSKTNAAEKAAQVKSEFLANMSHEVRTPINGVLGMTELLINTPLSPKQKRYAETISKSGKSLLSVINDILDFSKIEAGKLELSKGAFDLREVVEDVVELLAESAHKKEVELCLNMEPDFHVACNGDANRLRQVLLNLLGNAIKFTQEGEVQLVVSSQLDGVTEKVRFDVIDTGVGIPDTALKTIFESFEQADGTSTRQFGGTGLGLAISSKLVQLMGGEIGVESELGKGSTFWFTAELEKLPNGIELVWRRKDSLVDKKILIVDDNVTNREILNAQLAYWGAEPQSVDDGAAALELLRGLKETSSSFDAAILDMQMPGMNGLELAEAIKSQNLAPDTRMILLSSAGDQLNADDCQRAGIHSHATKPVRQPDLYSCITAVLNANWAEDDLLQEAANDFQFNSISGSVLLAEDNIVNQEMMMELLSQLGVDAELAENGQKVLDALEQKTFDVILMDCQMPVLDGFAATARIREMETENSGRKRMPIIALTANAMEGYREKCLNAGMDEYLSKPISSKELIKKLSQWLKPASVEKDSAGDIEKLKAMDQSVRSDPSAVLSGNEQSPDATAIPETEPETDPETDIEEVEFIDEAVFAELLTMCEQAPPGFYNRLIDKYDSSANEDITQLREAIETDDAACVGSCAHRLKSSSANWGAKRLASACQNLELAGKAAQLDNASELLEKIEVEFEEVLIKLKSRSSRAA